MFLDLAKLVFFNNETTDDGEANAVIQVLKGANADSAETASEGASKGALAP